jgi:hypothetical protein
MIGARQVEDRLRAEYIDLFPSMQRTLTALTTEVNHVLLSTILNLDRHEQILVKAPKGLRKRNRLVATPAGDGHVRR